MQKKSRFFTYFSVLVLFSFSLQFFGWIGFVGATDLVVSETVNAIDHNSSFDNSDNRVSETEYSPENQTISLENNYIRRNFSITNGKFKTVSIENLLTTESSNILTPATNSDEFTINLLPPPRAVTPKNWTVTVSSESTTEGTRNTKNAIIDGDISTHWHSNYGTGHGPVNAGNNTMILSFGEAKNIRSFGYTPRQTLDVNGNIKGYKFFVKTSQDQDFVKVAEGELLYDSTATKWVELSQTYRDVVEIKFEMLTSRNGRNQFAAIAEFDVSEQTVLDIIGTADSRTIKAPDLTVKSAKMITDDIAKKMVVEFLPINKFGQDISIKYLATLNKQEKFIRTNLEIDTTDDKTKIAIDTIDLQSLNITETDNPQTSDVIWKLPQQDNISEMGGFKGFYAGLGQPVYLRGAFYTGSNFPLAHNTVENGKLFSRYYSGKTLAQLNESSAYQTWGVIIGVGRNNDKQVLQQDFYDYIRSVGTKTTFRKQYNSWFDYMKDINANNIQESFKEIDDGFASYGVAPLDSYVVDDGWQDSNTLWGFNQKFPNKLYTSSKDVKRIGSNFGLWLGPQGGYGGGANQMARALTQQGLASMNGGVIHVGDKRYVDNLKERMLDYQNKFDINYWKLDGMLLNPVSNTTPYFIGGGYLNMYSMTETHERWIGIYEALRQNRENNGAKLWINLTSYINPSPWFLQWVNSIWMQNAGDVDYQDRVKYNTIDFGDDAAEAITYRDDRYHQLVNVRDWQLPFSNIYNHDPVYGNRAHESKNRPPIRFSDEGFRDYLYTLGTRGTGFWEFYYSYELMNEEKWQINAEAVNWIEDNFEILRNAKIHGGRPGDGEVYGYSAWTKDEGIISVRNPKNTRQTYNLLLDNQVGMHEGTANLYRKVVHGKEKHNFSGLTNYGDTLSLTLEPYEAVVLQYSTKQDLKAPGIKGSRFLDNTTVELEFDEKVDIKEASFVINDQPINSPMLEADFRTVKLTIPSGTQHGEKISITYNNVKDVAGIPNKASGVAEIVFYKNGYILNLPDVQNGVKFQNNGVSGNEEFTITLTANLAKYGQLLAKQGDEWQLFVDEDGKVNFTVKGTNVKSAPFTEKLADDSDTVDKQIPLNKDVHITAVRYENGSIRLYINGLVSNSAYSPETAKFPLAKATLQLSDNDFSGTLSDFKIRIGANKYTEIAKEANVENGGLKIVEIPIENSSASSEDPNDSGRPRPAEAATDGDVNTWWASNPSIDNRSNPQNLTIELEEMKDVKVVTYIPRQNAPAVGNIISGKIQVSEDGNIWQDFPTEGYICNWDPADSTAQQVVADEPIRAKYVRLTATDAYHWDTANNKNGTVLAAAELSAWGEKVKELTFDYLNEVVKEIDRIDRNNYIENEELVAVLTEAKNLLANRDEFNGTQVTIDNLTSKLQDIIHKMQLKPADYTKVNKLKKIAESLDPTNYENFSELSEVLNGLDLSKSIVEQAEVDAMVISLENSLNSLRRKPDILVDKTSNIGVVLVHEDKFAIKPNLYVSPKERNDYVDYYNITLKTLADETYNFQGSAKIKLPVVDSKPIKGVFYLNENGEKELLVYNQLIENEKKFVEFTTTHFSIYGVEYEKTKTNDDNEHNSNNDKVDNKVDNSTTSEPGVSIIDKPKKPNANTKIINHSVLNNKEDRKSNEGKKVLINTKAKAVEKNNPVSKDNEITKKDESKHPDKQKISENKQDKTEKNKEGSKTDSEIKKKPAQKKQAKNLIGLSLISWIIVLGSILSILIIVLVVLLKKHHQ